jgi:uncharacterized protein YggE
MKNRNVVSLAALLILAARSPAAAHNAESGIEVTAVGESRAKPNCVEIEVSAGGLAELSSDAVVKYRDSLRRMTDAFQKLKMEGLEVQPQQVSIGTSGGQANNNMVAVIGNRGGGGAKTQIEIGRSLKLMMRYKSDLPEGELLDRITKLLDTAKDAGASVGKDDGEGALARMMGQSVGTSPAVMFVCEDAEKYREQAYERAFAQAERDAQRLARLAHVRLGAVLAISEVDQSQPSQSMQEKVMSAIYGIGKSNGTTELRISSHEMGDIPLRVTLAVRFAVEPLEKSR